MATVAELQKQIDEMKAAQKVSAPKGKPVPAWLTVEVKDENGRVLSMVKCSPHVFKSGSHGFYGNTKIELADGSKLQAGYNLTVIGSKPTK